MRSTLSHRALAHDLATLAVAVVDNRRLMLLVMRAIGSTHANARPKPSTRCPDLLIAADIMQPLTGPVRRERSGPLPWSPR